MKVEILKLPKDEQSWARSCETISIFLATIQARRKIILPLFFKFKLMVGIDNYFRLRCFSFSFDDTRLMMMNDKKPNDEAVRWRRNLNFANFFFFYSRIDGHLTFSNVLSLNLNVFYFLSLHKIYSLIGFDYLTHQILLFSSFPSLRTSWDCLNRSSSHGMTMISLLK